MKKYITHIALVLLCITNITLLADSNSCGPINFNLNREYPYKVCQDGIVKTECIMGSMADTNTSILRVPSLPICYDLVNMMQVALTGTVNGYYYYVNFLTAYATVKDLATASNKWNCICDATVPPNQCETVVAVWFTDDVHKFNDPYTEASSAQIYDEDSCKDLKDIVVYFNGSAAFQAGTPCYRPFYNDTVITNRALMNNDYILDSFNYFKALTYWDKLTGDTADYVIYNFVDVAIQQLGEILGLGYSEECGCGQSSIMNPEMPYPVNSGVGLFGSPVGFGGLGGEDNLQRPVHDCDKSAFKALYCPTLSIADNPTEQKTFPNPSDKSVNIDFNVERESYVSISIMDVFGRVLLSPISNKHYIAGNYIEQIDISELSVGYYYAVVDYGFTKSVQQIAIAR